MNLISSRLIEHATCDTWWFKHKQTQRLRLQSLRVRIWDLILRTTKRTFGREAVVRFGTTIETAASNRSRKRNGVLRPPGTPELFRGLFLCDRLASGPVGPLDACLSDCLMRGDRDDLRLCLSACQFAHRTGRQSKFHAGLFTISILIPLLSARMWLTR